MVNLIIVSEYSRNPPVELREERIKIAGPLYELDRVKALAGDDGCNLSTWTRRCTQDVNKWFDDDFEVLADMFSSLREKDYRGSEWCTNGGRAIAACDAYLCHRVEASPSTGKRVSMEYYLKFAISKTGSLLLLVSCHT